MNKTEYKTVAKFGAKATCITLWILAFLSLGISLRALSLIKPEACIAMCAAAFVFSVMGTLAGVYAAKTKLEVTEDCVICRTLCKDSRYLPLKSVTGIRTGLFNTICITSASFKIKCSFVKNRDEILECIKKSFENQ